MFYMGKFMYYLVYIYYFIVDMIFILGDNVCYYIFFYFFFIGFRNYIESQWQDIGCYCIVIIEYVVGIKNMWCLYWRSFFFNCKEMGVEVVFDFCCIFFEFFCFIFQIL